MWLRGLWCAHYAAALSGGTRSWALPPLGAHQEPLLPSLSALLSGRSTAQPLSIFSPAVKDELGGGSELPDLMNDRDLFKAFDLTLVRDCREGCAGGWTAGAGQGGGW